MIFAHLVIEAIELDGMPKTEASQTFHVSRNTINLWLQRKATTGDYQALPNKPPGKNGTLVKGDRSPQKSPQSLLCQELSTK